jgi:hypothetical protein
VFRPGEDQDGAGRRLPQNRHKKRCLQVLLHRVCEIVRNRGRC